MSKVVEDITDLIGNTPILHLNKYTDGQELYGDIYVKLEYFNPLGSIKDRAAYAMITKGIKEGKINKDTVLIEPTSGNTGIGLAYIAASMGLKLILTMPETMSIERRRIVAAFGAEVVLTSGSLGMKGAIEKAEELARDNDNSFIPGQFVNSANPDIHEKTTAPEIYQAMDGKVDYFVSAVGTGGTVTGTGRGLKKLDPKIKVVAVEPLNSPVLSGGQPSPHKIQGIGAGFIPEIMDLSIVDEIIKVADEDAFLESRKVAKSEGVFVGISSGAALKGALEIAKRPESKGKNIVVILPDTGERYLSTPLFE